MKSSTSLVGIALLAFAQCVSAGRFTETIYSCPSALTEYLTITVAVAENSTQTTREPPVVPWAKTGEWPTPGTWTTTAVQEVCYAESLSANVLTKSGDHHRY